MNAINDKSQGSITKRLRCDVLLYYKFIIQFADERVFKIVEHLAKLQAEWLIVSYAPFALSSKMHNSPDKQNNACYGRKRLYIHLYSPAYIIQKETINQKIHKILTNNSILTNKSVK